MTVYDLKPNHNLTEYGFVNPLNDADTKKCLHHENSTETNKMGKDEKKDEKAAPPIKKFTAGGITASVWENKKDDETFKTITIQKRYKDKDGNFKDSTSFNTNDVRKLECVLGKAYEFIVMKELNGE